MLCALDRLRCHTLTLILNMAVFIASLSFGFNYFLKHVVNIVLLLVENLTKLDEPSFCRV